MYPKCSSTVEVGHRRLASTVSQARWFAEGVSDPGGSLLRQLPKPPSVKISESYSGAWSSCGKIIAVHPAPIVFHPNGKTLCVA